MTSTLRSRFTLSMWPLVYALCACGAQPAFELTTARHTEARSSGDECWSERQIQPRDSTREGGRRFALVIGNNAYPTGPLLNAKNDAKAIASSLESLGFAVEVHTDANRATMQEAIRKLGERGGAPGDIKLFYYAGHGVAFNGSNYLIPVDADIRDAQSVTLQAAAAEDVLAAMSTGASSSIAILDACRDNPFPSLARTMGSRGLVTMSAPSGSLIAYATAPGETARDGILGARLSDGSELPEGHGVFTGALLRHIADEGLTVEQMLKRTAADVRKATAEAQRPWTSFDWPDDVILNPARRAHPDEILELIAESVRVGDYVSAVRDAGRILSLNGALSPEQRARTEQLHAEAKRRLTRLDLQIRPADASVRVDGTSYRSNAGHLCLNPGQHDIEIFEGGYHSLVREVQLSEGRSQALRARLTKEARDDFRPLLAWSLGATGGAALVVSLATRIRAREIDDKLDSVCGGLLCPADATYDWPKMQERGRRLEGTSSAALGIGLAGVGLNALILLRPTWFGGERRTPQLTSLVCSGDGCRAQSGIAF